MVEAPRSAPADVASIFRRDMARGRGLPVADDELCVFIRMERAPNDYWSYRTEDGVAPIIFATPFLQRAIWERATFVATGVCEVVKKAARSTETGE